jgi:hypothetical protein
LRNIEPNGGSFSKNNLLGSLHRGTAAGFLAADRGPGSYSCEHLAVPVLHDAAPVMGLLNGQEAFLRQPNSPAGCQSFDGLRRMRGHPSVRLQDQSHPAAFLRDRAAAEKLQHSEISLGHGSVS